MNSPTDRKVVVALLAIFVVCLVGLGGSLYRTKAAELKSLRAELAKKTEERDKVKAQIARMPELETKYAQLQERLSILEPALPDSAYIPTFLRQIENLAVGTNNQIVAIRPRPEIKPGTGKGKGVQVNDETGDVVQGGEEPSAAGAEGKEQAKAPKLPYRFIPIEVKTEGTYWTAVDFLRELQRFPKMIAVNNVAFTPKLGGRDSTTAERRVLLTTMDMLAVVATTKGQTDGSAQPK
jgi:Tfp pilus assembly protein PilO